MSARGETFVSEEVRNTYEKELDKAFGKDKWRLHLKGAYNLCDERLFPDNLEIDVLDYETNEKIGVIEVGIRKYVEDWGYGAFIEIEPNGLSIYNLEGTEINEIA